MLTKGMRMLGVLEWTRKVRWWLVKFRYVRNLRKLLRENKPILKTKVILY